MRVIHYASTEVRFVNPSALVRRNLKTVFLCFGLALVAVCQIDGHRTTSLSPLGQAWVSDSFSA